MEKTEHGWWHVIICVFHWMSVFPSASHLQSWTCHFVFRVLSVSFIPECWQAKWFISSAFCFSVCHTTTMTAKCTKPRSTIRWLVSIKDPAVDKLTVPLTQNALLFLHLPVVVLDVQISIRVFSSASEEPGCLLSFSTSLFYASCNSLGAKRRCSFFVCVFNFQQWWDDCVLFHVVTSLRSDAESV